MIRLDPTRRTDAIEAGWQAYSQRCPQWRDAYIKACAAWLVVAVVADDEVIGALFERNGEIHLGIVPAWRGRWASRRLIRQMLCYGTRTTMLNGEDTGFIERIGFEKRGNGYEFHGANRRDGRQRDHQQEGV